MSKHNSLPESRALAEAARIACERNGLTASEAAEVAAAVNSYADREALLAECKCFLTDALRRGAYSSLHQHDAMRALFSRLGGEE